jgi:hypothetical protein
LNDMVYPELCVCKWLRDNGRSVWPLVPSMLSRSIVFE